MKKKKLSLGVLYMFLYIDINKVFVNTETIYEINALSNYTNSENIRLFGDKNIEQLNKCNSFKLIEDYFFNVYSSNSTNEINSNDLNELIAYHVMKTRSKTVLEKHKKHKCELQTCFQSEHIFRMTNLSIFTRKDFQTICPLILYNLEMDSCLLEKQQAKMERHLVWLIGLGFVTIVTIWSWIGGLVLPFMSSPLYKKILTGMIGLACGCVLSNSLLNFIPKADAFDNNNIYNPNTTFFFKHLLILSVILFLFSFERTMKLIAFYKKEISDKNKLSKTKVKSNISRGQFNPMFENSDINDVCVLSYNQINRDENEYQQKIISSINKLKKNPTINLAEVHIMGIQSLNEVTDNFADKLSEINPQSFCGSEVSNINDSDAVKIKSTRVCCTSLTKNLSKVRPIGWMAIFGDGLSNFIDGLSIGASINQGFSEGLTVAIPVWLGNIPQELGDFALLIRAGMTPFQALFYNYISALGAYVGFTVSCIAGESLLVARWIFAVSGATSMYMGLAVLLPEIIKEFEEAYPVKEKLKVTVIQVTGIVLGYTILTLLRIFEDDIVL